MSIEHFFIIFSVQREFLARNLESSKGSHFCVTDEARRSLSPLFHHEHSVEYHSLESRAKDLSLFHTRVVGFVRRERIGQIFETKSTFLTFDQHAAVLLNL